ncbi:S-adenosyl methyltransferase [Actinopolyspora lacussalsi subsp. righensis]|uniref:S-adenosyl methyltransferase n=1 Tax=Actinopolyspora righensis TaxID=995060 RepID=A0A1I7BCU8_9ACTN|nr:SAM-dependent methyltransferase [Actinopolyspora righensis]SFT84964.1 S-adenosyl methyltransferase [Actinopolyspora righensis]
MTGLDESPDHGYRFPGDTDVGLPNPARVYDYWLGGSANFAVDRELGDHIAESEPRIASMARENRSLLRRMVTHCCRQGVNQFLDLGSGVPTIGNVHEIAHRHDPDSRVVYVDNEPVAVSHSELLLEGTDKATILRGDLTDPAEVLNSPVTRGMLDLNRPVAVLLLCVLQYFPDTDRLRETVASYRTGLAPGSYIAISHLTTDDGDVNTSGVAERIQHSRASHQAYPRGYEEVLSLFEGTRLVEPGVRYAQDWHHGEIAGPTEPSGIYAGLARVPE